MRLRARATAAAAAAVLLLAGLGACSSGASSGGASVAGGSAAGTPIAQLTGGDVNFYSTVDPNKTQGCNDNYCGLFLEHLQQLGQGNVLKPELATSVSQPNPLTYVYHLRHGVTYGQLLKQIATDVPYVPLFSAYSFTALSSKYTLPPFPDYAAFFSWALGIKAVS